MSSPPEVDAPSYIVSHRAQHAGRVAPQHETVHRHARRFLADTACDGVAEWGDEQRKAEAVGDKPRGEQKRTGDHQTDAIEQFTDRQFVGFQVFLDAEQDRYPLLAQHRGTNHGG